MDRFPRCAACGNFVSPWFQPHHWVTKGAGGSDEDENLDRLCKKHHGEAHYIGIKEMAVKYGLGKPREILKNRGTWTDGDEQRYQSASRFSKADNKEGAR